MVKRFQLILFLMNQSQFYIYLYVFVCCIYVSLIKIKTVSSTLIEFNVLQTLNRKYLMERNIFIKPVLRWNFVQE